MLFVAHATCSAVCPTVKQGEHYSELIPFHGFKSNLIISVRLQLNNNTAWYLFPSTESTGESCSNSWNKLWGATRCGYLADVHEDSDRFMWRRAVSCLIFDDEGHEIGEKSNCSEANLIEIVAAAYDGGVRPYDRPGTLLKQFDTKLRVDTWYGLTLQFSENQTIYQLFDDAGSILETQTINHRICPKFNEGALLDLYFGGICPAPQAVTVCYDQQNATSSTESAVQLKNNKNRLVERPFR